MGEAGVVVAGAAGEDDLAGGRGRGGGWIRSGCRWAIWFGFLRGEDRIGDGEDDAAEWWKVGQEERREVFGHEGREGGGGGEGDRGYG